MKLVAGPLIGYRAWKIDKDYVLRSLNDGRVWTPRLATVGRCQQSHPVPAPACTCGCYAYKQPADVGSDGSVRGAAALWGHVVSHARGWRAQFAYPVTLWEESGVDASQLDAVAKLYRCQVTTRPAPGPISPSATLAGQDRLRQQIALEQEFGSLAISDFHRRTYQLLEFRLFNVRFCRQDSPDEVSCCLLPEPILQRIAELNSRNLTVKVVTYWYGQFGRPWLHELAIVVPGSGWQHRYIIVWDPWPCGGRRS